VGQAYLAGVVAALHQTLGWDARTADLVVGSSAGSVTGTALRMGVAPSDLVATATGTPLSAEGARLYEQILPDSSELPTPPTGSWFRPWRPPTAALVSRTLHRPLGFRPSVAAVTMLPPGKVRLDSRALPLQRMLGDTWPTGLWICAVRRSDGARVVFGRPGSPATPLAPAVLASCAIPGYFAPVSIDGVEYLDGGVHSATNADVLRTEGLDVAVVVAPMSSSHRQSRSAAGPIRWSVHRRLHRESLRLSERGTIVIRFEPGTRTLRAMGYRMMANDRSDRVAEAAAAETRDQIEAEGLRHLLGSVQTRSTSPTPSVRT